MDDTLRSKLRQYVNPDRPVGPSDAAFLLSTDIALAAALFDPYNHSFNSLLNKSLSVIIGRRGSGKTALLHSYMYTKFLPRLRHPGHRDFDLNDYHIIIRVESHTQFIHIKELVSQFTDSFVPIEVVVDGWQTAIGSLILQTISQSATSTHTSAISQIRSYILSDEDVQNARDLVRGPGIPALIASLFHTPDHPEPRNMRDALVLAEHHLQEVKQRAVVLVDSLDQWPVGRHNDDQVICGLTRFAEIFNTQYTRMKLKVCVPAEIYPELTRASANPLKDFAHVDRVKWTSNELSPCGGS